MRLAVAFAVLSGAVWAGEFESLQVVNAGVQQGRFTTIFHGRVRSRDHATDLYQARGGPIVNIRLLPRLTGIVGHYSLWEQPVAGHWGPHQRTFGGAEFAFLRSRKWVVEGRSMVEGIYAGNFDSYMRYRERARVTGPQIGRVRPITHAEILFVRGNVLHRYMLGLRWDLGARSAETYYEQRRSPGTATHIIGTTISVMWKLPHREKTAASVR